MRNKPQHKINISVLRAVGALQQGLAQYTNDPHCEYDELFELEEALSSFQSKCYADERVQQKPSYFYEKSIRFYERDII